jgi:hypothetical protein
MRRLWSCLMLSFAAFFLPSVSTEAAAGFRGHHGYGSGPALVRRFHPPADPLAYRHPGLHGRYLHKPLIGRYGLRPFRYGVLPYGYGSWPLIGGAAGPLVKTTIVNQVGASSDSRGSGGVPAVAGIPSPPVAAPVVYVITADRSPPRMCVRKDFQIRPGPKVASLYGHEATPLQHDASGAPSFGTGPRIIHVTVPRRR